MNCLSSYTINHTTGEKLVCDREQAHPHQHTASAYGNIWYWSEREADKGETDG